MRKKIYIASYISRSQWFPIKYCFELAITIIFRKQNEPEHTHFIYGARYRGASTVKQSMFLNSCYQGTFQGSLSLSYAFFFFNSMPILCFFLGNRRVIQKHIIPMQVLTSSTALQCLRIGVKINRSQNTCVNVDVLKGRYNIAMITVNIY